MVRVGRRIGVGWAGHHSGKGLSVRGSTSIILGGRCGGGGGVEMVVGVGVPGWGFREVSGESNEGWGCILRRSACGADFLAYAYGWQRRMNGFAFGCGQSSDRRLEWEWGCGRGNGRMARWASGHPCQPF